MKHALYIFNPEHDLALANGDKNYYPPVGVRKMVADLAMLPAWYAEEGSYVKVPFLPCDKNTKEKDFLFPPMQWITDLSSIEITEVLPWGWDPAVIKQLQLAQVPEILFPDTLRMETIRQFSHRSFSALLLNSLLQKEKFCGSATCLASVAEVKSFLVKHRTCVLKAPWSSSGKGLHWCKDGYDELTERWTKKILSQQKCVIGEIIYTKVKDFAMEFFSNGCGEVTFAGYSLFCTDERGRYKNNILASDEYILSYLSKYVEEEEFIFLREELERSLSLTIGKVYRGYLGVDMMICFFQNKPVYRIHPCVEVNLRMNMGMVARLFTGKYVKQQSIGSFSIHHFSGFRELKHYSFSMQQSYPLKIEKGKIKSGYLSLTPLQEGFTYGAAVLIY